MQTENNFFYIIPTQYSNCSKYQQQWQTNAVRCRLLWICDSFFVLKFKCISVFFVDSVFQWQTFNYGDFSFDMQIVVSFLSKKFSFYFILNVSVVQRQHSVWCLIYYRIPNVWCHCLPLSVSSLHYIVSYNMCQLSTNVLTFMYDGSDTLLKLNAAYRKWKVER